MEPEKLSNFLPQEKVVGRFDPGERIGKLTIEKFVEVDSRGRNVYICKCDCGKTVTKYSSYTGIRSISCGCWKIKKYKEIPREYWYDLIRNAGRRHITFNINQKDAWKIYMKQKRKCALSGEDIVMGENASLDRIDSSKDYTVDNIHWVTAEHNVSKMDFTLDRYVEMSKHVTLHKAKKSKKFLEELKKEVNSL